ELDEVGFHERAAGPKSGRREEEDEKRRSLRGRAGVVADWMKSAVCGRKQCRSASGVVLPRTRRVKGPVRSGVLRAILRRESDFGHIHWGTGGAGPACAPGEPVAAAARAARRGGDRARCR